MHYAFALALASPKVGLTLRQGLAGIALLAGALLVGSGLAGCGAAPRSLRRLLLPR